MLDPVYKLHYGFRHGPAGKKRSMKQKQVSLLRRKQDKSVQKKTPEKATSFVSINGIPGPAAN